jgi:hypothetical protein
VGQGPDTCEALRNSRRSHPLAENGFTTHYTLTGLIMRMRNTFASRARLKIRQKFEHGAGMCLGGTAAPPLSGCDKKRAPPGLQTLTTPHMRDQGWSSAPASSDTAEQLQKYSTAQYCVQYENAIMFPSRSAHQNALSARPPSQISPQCRSHVLHQAEVRTGYCRICL